MGIARLGGQWGRQLAAPPAAAGKGRPGISGADDSAPPAPAPAPAPDENENFEALTKYIPTETITLFVAAVGAWDAIRRLDTAAQSGPSLLSPDTISWMIYAVFAILTPLLVWLSAYSSYWRARKALPEGTEPAAFVMPKFRMVAALIAFLVWALAVPGLLSGPVWQIVGPLAALVVSTFLSLFEPIFGN